MLTADPPRDVPLADAFRCELVSATRRGQAFSLTTGRPVSHQSGANTVNW